MKQLKAPVVSSVEAMPDIYLMWLEAPGIADTARPGQFVMAGCGGDTILHRPFSVHRVDGSQLALLFSVVGKGTSRLSQVKKGDTIDIFGPLGNGFRINPASKNLLLVAGGMGIAPLSFLAETAASLGYTIKIHQGANTSSQLFLKELSSHYQSVPTYRTIESSSSTADGSFGITGMATVVVPGLAAWADQVFACGPVAMYQAMMKIPELKGKDVQLSLEIMMGCGVGVCYGCTIKTKSGLKQVCKDGPVFEMGEVEWE
jgi:dihydroorotate dehydrogenase electron transfer subunit